MSSPAAAPPAGGRPAALGFILFTVFLDAISFGIVIPVLPFLIASFFDGDLARAADVNGIFGTGWAAMQFLFSPLLGALSDRYGRRAVLLTSLGGMGLDYLLMATAPTLALLFVGRVIAGITAATYSTAYAYIADTTAEQGRARAFGLVGAIWGVGFVVGPALGGLLGSISQRLPFWVAAVLALGNVLYGVFVLPESLPAEKRGSFSWASANPLGSIGLLRARRGLAPLALMQFLYSTAHYVLPQIFVLYSAYRYHWSPSTVGVVLAVVGICTAIVQGGLIGPIVARLGESRSLLAGLLAGAASFALYGFAPTGPWFLAAIPLGAFMGLYNPAAQALMTRLVQPDEQGRLQGVNSSLMGIGGLIAPLLYNGVFAYAIAPPRSLAGAPFYVASALLVAALALRLARAR